MKHDQVITIKKISPCNETGPFCPAPEPARSQNPAKETAITAIIHRHNQEPNLFDAISSSLCTIGRLNMRS